MNEVWNPIKGYEGLYEVSNLGLAKSLDRIMRNNRKYKGRILYISKPKYGYNSVVLSKNGHQETVSIHRLVAIVFVENPMNLNTVNHINEIKTDNRACNLEWMSHRDNCNYSKNKKSSSKYAGVSWSSRNKKWRVMLSVNCKVKHVGLYKTEIEAHNAYVEFLKENNLS